MVDNMLDRDDEDIDKDKVTEEARKIWDEMQEEDTGEGLTEKEMKIKAVKKAIGEKVDKEDIYLLLTLTEFIKDIHEENRKQEEGQIGSGKEEKDVPGHRYR